MSDISGLIPLIQAHEAELQKPGVVAVRPGYQLESDWPTTIPAIVVIVSKTAGHVALPKEIEGVPVDIRTATAPEELHFQNPARYARLAGQRAEFRTGAFPSSAPVAAAKPEIAYTAPAGVKLDPVTGKFTITCHASPDAGWPTLRTFLGGIKSQLTVGMYDFTSGHILKTVSSSLAGKKDFTITLDNPAKNPTADQSDTQTLASLDASLGKTESHHAWALVQSNSAIKRWIFPTAYHIKVAVRDSAAMWLSSGNWNNSNQPDFDPIGKPSPTDQETARKSDRDWHVIIEHAGLSKTFEAYLKHDFEVARTEESSTGVAAVAEMEPMPEVFPALADATFEFHKPLQLSNEPMTITPLLTPDPGVYRNTMLKLLQSAKTRIYIQLQYIHPSDNAEDSGFTDLLKVVIAKIAAGVDVRLILSQWQTTSGWLERLQSAGVDLKTVRIQNGVHNKGFVVDSKSVALGSQNWSAEGVLRNRDASVIIDNVKAAKYYESIFLHDWDRIAKQKMS